MCGRYMHLGVERQRSPSPPPTSATASMKTDEGQGSSKDGFESFDEDASENETGDKATENQQRKSCLLQDYVMDNDRRRLQIAEDLKNMLSRS